MLAKRILMGTLLSIGSCAFAAPQAGPYLNIELGGSVAHYTNDSDAVHEFFGRDDLYGASVNNDNFAPLISLGYQFNQYFALEASYTYLGTIEYNHIYGISGADTTITQQAGELAAKINLPLGDKFNVFALGGGAYVNGEQTVNSTAESLGLRKRGGSNAIRPLVGVGASYDLNNSWSLDASWREIVEGNHFATTDFFGGGVTYHFG